ncbi:MAG: hypothetical protein AAF557_00055 [Pseudomonadota bacterium]
MSGAETETVVLLFEGFGGDLETVESSDFYSSGGEIKTNGRNDGELLFQAVDFSGMEAPTISFDAEIENGSFEEFGTRYGDFLKIEFVDRDGNVHLLDMFTGTGQTLVGSETGQSLTDIGTNFSYTLPESITSGQLRITSDISARGERIAIDNVEITAERPVPEGQVIIDFESLADGTALSAGDGGTLVMNGVTFEAVKKGASTPDDAMIFDAANPTGGDNDLFQPANGNVLIVSEDGDASDPDDNAGGGTITATFDVPVTLSSIDVLDVEEPGGTMELFDENGALISTITIPSVGDGEILNFNLGDVSGVSQMAIHLPGSGAIDTLRFTPDAPPADPSTVIAEDDDGFLTTEDLFFLAGSDGEISLGNVYDNDSDPEGDPFSVSMVTGGTSDDTADADGYYGWVDASNGGQIRVNEDGSYQFRDVNDAVVDQLIFAPLVTTSIDYTIMDDTGATDMATISVTVAGGGLTD